MSYFWNSTAKKKRYIENLLIHSLDIGTEKDAVVYFQGINFFEK